MHKLASAAVAAISFLATDLSAQVEQRLRQQGIPAIIANAKKRGDARRGAAVFYRPQLTCIQCHVQGDTLGRLGPDLASLGKDVTDTHLIESIFSPSKAIRKGFETTMVSKGEATYTGFLVSESKTEIVIRAAEKNFATVTVKRDANTEVDRAPVSLMPPGLTNVLANEGEFYDLLRYLMAIRDGGRAKANELRPASLAAAAVPEYEKRVDHRGFITSFDRDGFRRGQKIYERLCVNCHGTHKEEGSLPTSLRFASGKFKNGSDPFAMYQTLTHGFGMMMAQAWMVPTQKYDVIHYIREAYLKKHNPSQYTPIDAAYLAGLPEGDTRGPAPSNITAWQQMDYGPNQMMTVEIGKNAKNFAYKGNVIRVDEGPGGISRGRHWVVFDYDTMRIAAAWSGDDAIDWNSIHFNGRHAIHPRVVGELHAVNPTGPGWGRPTDGSFEDVRLVGRDKRIYGPLPRSWAQYRGMYYHGRETVISYTVGAAKVLETHGLARSAKRPVFTRTINIGARQQDLVLQVAHRPESNASLTQLPANAVVFGPAAKGAASAAPAMDQASFNGGTRLEVGDVRGLNVGRGDFTITARIKTKHDGTILAQTSRKPEWVADGLTWFLRDGRLTVDIGWVGAHNSRRRVNNGKWHDVAVSYKADTGRIEFFIDGKRDRRVGRLKRNKPLRNPVVRIGYTAADFPRTRFFKGQMGDVKFFNQALTLDQVRALRQGNEVQGQLAAHWNLAKLSGGKVRDTAGQPNDARVFAGRPAAGPAGVRGVTVAGVAGDAAGMSWTTDAGNLRLKIPAGPARRFTVWFGTAESAETGQAVAAGAQIAQPSRDLQPLTKGGPRRWPEVLTTEAILPKEDGPFAVDVLQRPKDNPWFCRLRLTGFDFTDDGDTAIVSAWDGSMWKVTGLKALPTQTAEQAGRAEIRWRRIASGLYQPLGVKIVDGKIYVTCRDQLCVLHDLNGDEEIDWFECFNNDHQVTDHFHEFAMGLQTDDEGNFYYAKSARHALTALVPHHGTLLKVSKDGQKTEIVATGFRAANGVCINPDGTFIVTDQEGHWNPKNRINYVKKGGFYGNMYGYHDVTDSSDAAMDQPLVWITNSFDRSPGELLWVDSKKWGPLNKTLLNLSYGYGTVYVVPHEDVDGQMQGGMCALPIDRFPTGVMRGRFHDGDGQLYLAGMFAWAGNQRQPGGLYRLRYTGRPVHLPLGLSATKKGIELRFSGRLQKSIAEQPSRYRIKIWDLRRTKSYGSKHYNEQRLEVSAAQLSEDGKTVTLTVPKIAPTWCMEIRYELQSTDGTTIKGNVHNTIHKLK